MQRIWAGLVPVMEEDGFTFVDVAPNSEAKFEPPHLPPELRPPMCSDVPEVIEAPHLLEPAFAPEPAVTQNEVCELSEDEETLVEDESVDDIGSLNLGDWRMARMRNSRMRVPPRRAG